ncbi:coiled-coil domain-containing protein 74B isoform X2 [Nothobranchius furzeri]|uniref:Si:ch211-222n4.2 n=1 Tax=Nothobranchius furzeri TaxID=105023 RepID=A0A8C6LHX8_NOTFU|nr:transcript variant X2 [Nothobranchius furzeri]
MSGSNSLPPLQHLPHWPRAGCLAKPCSPLPLPVNPPQHPLPAVIQLKARGVEFAAAEAAEESGLSGEEDPRIASLQRNIEFLQRQHSETLEKLHVEIEYLRRRNKELQYKLIMESSKSRGVKQSLRDKRPPTQGSEAHTGPYMEAPLQDTWPLQDRTFRGLEEGSKCLRSARPQRGADMMGHLITSLQPLRINSGLSHPPRAPTLQECEVIIRQLYNANSLQSQEIIRVKALLRDIVLSKKVTPENYILTKSYLTNGPTKSLEEKKFPKLGHQLFGENVSRPSQSGVVLPALKQSLNSSIAERQRRTRAMQRDRLKKTLW